MLRFGDLKLQRRNQLHRSAAHPSTPLINNLPANTLPPQTSNKVNIPRFLNRLLGLSIPEQQVVFDYFASTMDATIAAAKSKGQYGACGAWHRA